MSGVIAQGGESRGAAYVRKGSRLVRGTRIAITLAWIVSVETVVIALAATPALLAWTLILAWEGGGRLVRTVLLAASLVPGVVSFGLLVLALSAGAARLMRWRTPPHAEMIIADVEWPLLRWVCYAVSSHVARLLAGPWLRATPIWSWYLRANGARVGRRVYVNSLNISDHNLLHLDDDAIIGSNVHLSGHTVERGCVVTGGVRVGAGAEIGVQSVVGIDVVIGEHTQVGALSLVPKHSRLAPHARYVGIPVARLDAG